MDAYIIIQRLSYAFLFGLIIGLERQFRHRMSAVITNVLVALGACLFLMFGFNEGANERARLASQVISGIGFLGGGVIIRDGFTIRGLNTAATLWCSAAVGVLTSQGYIVWAFIGSLFIVGTNLLLKPLALRVEHSKYGNRDTEYNYKIKLVCPIDQEDMIVQGFRDAISNKTITIKGLESRSSDEKDTANIKIYIITFGQKEEDIGKILRGLKSQFHITSYSYDLEN